MKPKLCRELTPESILIIPESRVKTSPEFFLTGHIFYYAEPSQTKSSERNSLCKRKELRLVCNIPKSQGLRINHIVERVLGTLHKKRATGSIQIKCVNWTNVNLLAVIYHHNNNTLLLKETE